MNRSSGGQSKTLIGKQVISLAVNSMHKVMHNNIVELTVNCQCIHHKCKNIYEHNQV